MITRSRSGGCALDFSPTPDEGSRVDNANTEQLHVSPDTNFEPAHISLENGSGVADTYEIVPLHYNKLVGKRVNATFRFSIAENGRYKYLTAFSGVASDVYSRQVNGGYIEYVVVSSATVVGADILKDRDSADSWDRIAPALFAPHSDHAGAILWAQSHQRLSYDDVLQLNGLGPPLLVNTDNIQVLNSRRSRVAGSALPASQPSRVELPEVPSFEPLLAQPLGDPVPLAPPAVLPVDPLPFDPDSHTELCTHLIGIHLRSRKVSRLSAPHTWRQSSRLTHALQAGANGLVEWLSHVIAPFEAGEAAVLINQHDLLRALIAILELPGRCLTSDYLQTYTVDFVGSAEESTATIGTGAPPATPGLPNDRFAFDRSVLRANSLLEQGKPNQATKVLLSHGVAPPTKATRNNLVDLLVPGPSIKSQPLPVEQDLTEHSERAFALGLRRLSRKQSSSFDTFGWAGSLLRYLCKRKDGPSFVSVLARLLAVFSKLASAGVLSPAIVTCLQFSYQTPLNREAPAPNFEPRIRGIFTGTFFLKTMLSSTKRIKSLSEAAKATRPLQAGESQNGPESIAAFAQAAYNNGGVVLTTDDANAFNRLDRSHILNTVRDRAASSFNIINTFYCPPAPTVISWNEGKEGEDARRRFTVAYSTQGSRQGCTLGSLLYNLGKDPLYTKLAAEFRDSLLLKAHTDDLTAVAPVAPESWDDLYRTLAEFLERYDELLREVNCKMRLPKVVLLLPPGAPDPPSSLASLNLKIVRDGLVLMGAGIGTDDFIAAHAANRARELLRRADVVTKFGKQFPQAALRLLQFINLSLTYTARVTPPTLFRDVASNFDDKIYSSILDVLTPFDTDPRVNLATADPLTIRARDRVFLPFRLGGAGFLPFSRIGPGAYFASVAVSRIMDPRFASFDNFFKNGLADVVEDAWIAVRECVSQYSTEGLREANISHLDTLTGKQHDSVWSPSFVSDFSKKQNLASIQKKITDLVMDVSQSKTIADALEILTDDAMPAPRQREAAATIITQLKSETSRALQASYASRLNRIDSDLFRCGVRAFFGLPPIIFDRLWSVECWETGCRLQLCGPCLDSGLPKAECRIFPDGSHCQSSACKARRPAYTSHQAALHALVCLFARYGLVAKCDPATKQLLLGKYDEVFCNHLFPKNPGKRLREVANEIRAAARRASKSHDPLVRDIIMNRVAQLRRKYGNSVTGRRVDLSVESSFGTVTKLLCDWTVRHPLTASNFASTKSFCIKVGQDALSKKGGAASPQVMDLATSRVLTSAERAKRQTYEVLMKMVRYEHHAARLPKPDFYPLALTSFGEWSASLFKFMKDCTSQYYTHASSLARAGFYTDDNSLPDRKSSFVCAFKNVIACQTIATLGRLMLTAGDPAPLAAHASQH